MSYVRTPEILAKQRIAHLGMKNSEEAKQKMRGPRTDTPSYTTVHQRMRQVLPMECAFKDETCNGRLEVALRKDSGTLWSERFQSWFGIEERDYWRLCQSHHVRYDAGAKPGPKKGSHHGKSQKSRAADTQGTTRQSEACVRTEGRSSRMAQGTRHRAQSRRHRGMHGTVSGCCFTSTVMPCPIHDSPPDYEQRQRRAAGLFHDRRAIVPRTKAEQAARLKGHRDVPKGPSSRSTSRARHRNYQGKRIHKVKGS